MKKFMVILLAVIMLVPMFAIATPAATAIQIPYASTTPTIDGDGSDAIWEKAYKETLNPTVAASKGWYVDKKSNTSNNASAEIAVLWSEKGLYIKWDVTDPTQSFALDLPNNQLNSMDGVQFVIDPFNKRFASVKNCAFCFTFVPYTCQRGSGVGLVPAGEASWFEHWQWVATNASLGVQLAVKLDSRPDDVDDGVDRGILISGYHIETFVPVAAFNINGKDPAFAQNSQIGIGFMLIDYDFDTDKFAKNNQPEEGQIIQNFCSDFSIKNKTTDLGKPSKYNTATLVNELGDVPVVASPFDSLQAAIKLAEEYITNKALYTETSIAFLQTSIDEAKKLTASSSEAECTAAQEKLGTATNDLILLVDDTLATQIKLANSLVDKYNNEPNPYPVEAWTVFTDALAAAKALVEKEGFSEDSEEAKAAKLALEAARIALEGSNSTAIIISETDEFMALETAITAAEAVKKDEYTLSTYNVLKTALTNAKSVYDRAKAENTDVTIADVIAATQQLLDANSKLVRKDAVADANEESGGFPWWGILLIVIGVLAAAAVVTIIIVLNNNKKKNLAAVPAQVPNAPQAPADEAPAQEASTEGNSSDEENK